MEQLVKIRQTFPDGTAEVIRIRESSCSGDCHKCAGCGAAQETMLFRAENPIGARAGELVTIQSETKPVLAAAAVLYLSPVLLFFLGYFLGEKLWHIGAVIGCIAFALGVALAVVYDRRIAKKRKTVYTITGHPGDSSRAPYTERNNDLG